MTQHPDKPCPHYDVLLMEYASGCLDGALSLLVASHLTMSAAARRHVALYESLGGALMAECCEPVAMLENSLTAVLEQLVECTEDTPCSLTDLLHDFGITLPQPLQRHMTAQECQRRKWRRARRGVHVMTVPVPEGPFGQGFLIRAAAGATLPHQKTASREYTLVLEGRLVDRHGFHNHGDLFIIETHDADRPVADQNEGCVCLVLAEGAAPEPSFLARLFPFGF